MELAIDSIMLKTTRRTNETPVAYFTRMHAEILAIAATARRAYRATSTIADYTPASVTREARKIAAMPVTGILA